MTGYLGTPLAKKLGIKPGFTLAVVNPPGGYRQLVDPMPDGVTIHSVVTNSTDMVHLFCTQRADLISALTRTIAHLRQDAALWVSWPKKASKVPTDITEDTIRAEALPLGLVDVKVCAVDEIWSGLKLVVRKENRAGQTQDDPLHPI
ncbi:MAG: DUF3052 family protein [Bellilinea sp.]